MKVCTKCNQAKALDMYFVRDARTGRLHAQCKVCYKIHRRSYHLMHYNKYKDSYLRRAEVRNARIKSGLQQNMLAYLRDKTCEECGYSDIRALEFDHLEPNEKLFCIARGITNGLSWDKLLEEIKKCRILCANCHKIRTAKQQNWYRMARWPRS